MQENEAVVRPFAPMPSRPNTIRARSSNPRPDPITGVQKDAYFLSLLFTTISAGLMTAPPTFHRLRWRQGDKEEMLKIMNRLVITGGVFLALAMTAAFFVITDVIFGGVVAALWSTFAGATLFGLWYGLALMRKIDEAE